MLGAYSISFYRGDTRQHVVTFSPDEAQMANLSFREGMHGSGSGSISISPDDMTTGFANSLDKNSHFLTINDYLVDDRIIASGVVESAYEDAESFGAVINIRWYGVWEYLDEINVYTSFKSGALGSSVRIREGDASWSTRIHSVNSMYLIGEIFSELEANMAAANIDPFWYFADYGSGPTGGDWRKSYELSSDEFPTMQSIVSSILDDPDCDKFYITPEVSNGRIIYRISFRENRSSRSLNLATADVGELEFEDPQSTTARRSFAKNTSESGDTQLSNVPYSSGVTAYSTYLVNEGTSGMASASDIAAGNRSTVQRERFITGKLKYHTYSHFNAEPNTLITLMLPDSELSGVITETSFDGDSRKYEVTLTLSNRDWEVANFRNIAYDPAIAKYIRTPLGTAYRNARSSAMGGRTGWRSV